MSSRQLKAQHVYGSQGTLISLAMTLYLFLVRDKTLGISAVLLPFFVSVPAWADDTPRPATPMVLQDSNTGAVVSTPISPDGRYTVWDSRERAKGIGLHLTDLRTKSDSLILRDVEGWGTGFNGLQHLAFSPDGKRVMFIICPPNGSHCHGSRIYTVNIDGSNLTRAAISSFDAPTDTTYDIRSVQYSPDGTRLLIGITGEHDENVKEDDYEHLEPFVTQFFAIVPASSSGVEVKKQVKGIPLYWTNDGSAVFYKNRGIQRYDVASGGSVAISSFGPQLRIIGKAPGTDDAVFVYQSPSGFGSRCPLEGCTLKVISLDGKTIDPQLEALTTALPLQDADKRHLTSIGLLPDGNMLVRYQGDSPTLPTAQRQHLQVVQHP